MDHLFALLVGIQQTEVGLAGEPRRRSLHVLRGHPLRSAWHWLYGFWLPTVIAVVAGQTYNFWNRRSVQFDQGTSMSEATGTQLTRQSQELTIFHDVAKALTSSLDLDSILQTIMEKMAEYFRPDTWSLLMVDEEHNELYFAIAVGEAAEALKNVRLKVGEGIAGWVAKTGEQVISADVENDPRFAKRIDEATQWETHSVICVPLKSRLRVLGVIQLVNVDLS